MSDVSADILTRLFAKYRHSPNILEVLDILSNPLQDTNDAIDYILDHLSIGDAEGELLDFMGGWIGVNRQPAQEKDLLWLCHPDEVADDPDGRYSLAPEDLSRGGYLSAEDGCPSKSDPGSYQSDAEYRLYIRAKAATFRKKATPDIMYNYILQFGIRPKFSYGTRSVEIEPSSYDDFGLALRDHILNRGYRPAGISISIKPQTESDEGV